MSKAFGTTPQFWMNLQAAYDLEMVRECCEAQIIREVIPIRQE